MSRSTDGTIHQLFRIIVASFIAVLWIISLDNPIPAIPSTNKKNSASSNLPLSHKFIIDPTNCNEVAYDLDPHYTVQQYPNKSTSAVIDHAPWSAHSEINILDELLHRQILNVDKDELFIDVGANIGQMLMTGLVSNVSTIAFDPLIYDITKICTGVIETIARGFMPHDNMEKLFLFRAVVGNESKANVTISRPDDSFGKFEQASLFKDTIGVVKKPKLVEEVVPMVKLDDIVPRNVPVGLVKIDVQGFEWPVVQGMKGLLERTTGYPKIVHYEEQKRVTTLAGFEMGAVQRFLETFGYDCTNLGNDINCIKE